MAWPKWPQSVQYPGEPMWGFWTRKEHARWSWGTPKKRNMKRKVMGTRMENDTNFSLFLFSSCVLLENLKKEQINQDLRTQEENILFHFCSFWKFRKKNLGPPLCYPFLVFYGTRTCVFFLKFLIPVPKLFPKKTCQTGGMAGILPVFFIFQKMYGRLCHINICSFLVARNVPRFFRILLFKYSNCGHFPHESE